MLFQGLLVNGGYKNNQQMKFKDSSGASVKKFHVDLVCAH